MPHPVGFAVFCSVWLLAAAWAWRRWKEFANSPYNWIEFEDRPAADIESLDLHNPPSGPRAALPPPGEAAAIEPRVSLSVRFRQFLSDLRSGLRIFRRAPGFSMAAVALMAVGIGGNTAVYSLINGVLNKPAPGVRADNLVNIAATMPGDPNADVLAFPIYADFLAHSRTLQGIAAFGFERVAMTAPDGTYELRGELVTLNYFDIPGL